MAKKFAKFLLFVTTIGAAFAGVYYFMKSRTSSPMPEDDYEDLDDDSYEVADDSLDEDRSYVSLTADPDSEAETENAAEKSGTTVEEYFDDDDDDDSSLDAI